MKDLSAWFTDEERQKIEAVLAADPVTAEWTRTRADYKAVLDGCRFNLARAEHFREFCEDWIVQVTSPWTGKPLKLFPWQWTDWVGPLFGWEKPDGYRRFKKAFVFLPKKQGKSALVAAIQLYMLMFDGEEDPRCYCAANNRTQAQNVWAEAAQYVDKSPKLKKRLKVVPTRHHISYAKNYGKLLALSADKDSAEGINAHCAVYDEVHMAKNDGLYKLLQYSIRARKQPLLIYITTAGYDQLSICYSEYRYACKVRDDKVDDTSYLACIYEAPLNADISNPATWRMANPSIGLTVTEEDIRDDYMKAAAENRFSNFRQRILNQWARPDVTWIAPELWESCECDDPEEFEEKVSSLPCYFGWDMGFTDDLAAFVMVWRNEEGHYFLRPYFWAPEKKIQERSQTSNIPFSKWVSEGHLFECEGETNDIKQIEDFISQKAGEVNLQEFGVDQYQLRGSLQRFQSEGLEIVSVGQQPKDLSSATKLVERLVREGKLTVYANPVMAWMVDNVGIKSDYAGNIKPDKGKRSKDKIDGVSAFVVAMTCAEVHSDDSGECGFVVLRAGEPVA